MNIERTNRNRWLLLGLAVAAVVILTILAFRQVARWTGDGAEVWVASAGLLSGTTVGESDVKLARVDPRNAPASALRSREQIQGRQLVRRKQEGSAFTAEDFVAATARTPAVALTESIPEGRVLMPLQIEPSLLPSARLRRGDRLDILAAGRGAEPELVVRDAYLLGQNRSEAVAVQTEERRGPFGIDLSVSGERNKTPPLYLYLALHPEDAVTLARAQSARASLRFVMHAKADVESGRVADLSSQKKQTIEFIRGGDREVVAVAY